MPIINYDNLQYVGQFGFGTPPQKLKVVLDTGSTKLWLPIKGCKCHDKNGFNPNLSSSYYPT